MPTDSAPNPDATKPVDLRLSIALVWVAILFMVLRSPDKSAVDLFILFLAVASIGPLLGSSRPRTPVSADHLPPLSTRCQEVARDPRRKIEAIKIYREETGRGLSDAKTAVEAFMANLA